MAVLAVIVVLYILWSLFTGSENGKVVLFLGIVALLAYIGSKIIPFLIYISYGAIILVLLMLGIMVFQALFK